MSKSGTTPELIAILRRGFESKDLDHKGPCSWDETDKKGCCVVKDVLGMANMLGGYIVGGVAEVAAAFSWDGLTEDQIDNFDFAAGAR